MWIYHKKECFSLYMDINISYYMVAAILLLTALLADTLIFSKSAILYLRSVRASCWML